MRMSARSVLPFALVFISSSLLFVVQPMLGKWLLPSLGGSSATWSACLMSFQALLLAGYCQAAWLTSRCHARTAERLQIALAAAACIALWATSWSISSLPASQSVLTIPYLVLMRIGLPYLLLATTLPLLSHWLAPLGYQATGRLNAFSNAGALLGLLLYPFVVEPHLDIPTQLWLWSWGFLAFAALMTLACATSYFSRLSSAPTVGDTRPWPSARQNTSWLLCSLVPSALLLAATNHITTDVAATPLFWVVPLALYLTSFIIAFGAWRASWRKPVLLLWITSTAGLALNAFAQGAAGALQQISTTLLSLFAACLLCHGQLATTRPSTGLSRFYLTIAGGGALGGMLVSIVAPLVFSDQYELELCSLAIPFVLLLGMGSKDQGHWSRSQRLWHWLGIGFCVPLLLGSLLVRVQRQTQDGQVVERQRSFLGPLRVVDTKIGRLLIHGRIQHGMQLRDPTLQQTATMYFGPGTAVERVFQRVSPDRPRHIAVVGLGAGTLAVYGRPQDRIRFYEIDAKVIDTAQRHFTFLAESKARLDIVLGDGRISLSREPPQAFDILVLDAFSSDSVPVHLLTSEAFAIYRKHLAPEGVLLVNVSNRHLAVDRVVRASARVVNLHCMLIETLTNPAAHVSHVVWAVLGSNRDQLEQLLAPLPILGPTAPEVPWTDAKTSVLSILR